MKININSIKKQLTSFFRKNVIFKEIEIPDVKIYPPINLPGPKIIGINVLLLGIDYKKSGILLCSIIENLSRIKDEIKFRSKLLNLQSVELKTVYVGSNCFMKTLNSHFELIDKDTKKVYNNVDFIRFIKAKPSAIVSLHLFIILNKEVK